MDYQKLDAPLAKALTESQDAEASVWDIFIHTARALSLSEVALLQRLGVTSDARNAILTARLSIRAIDELTDQPWIRVLTLSQKLRPLIK